ncbi:glycerophosphodiester phosphodiesterase family protein [Vibrio sp. YMD68]|uniref:glycerophosphodiester phosphodiesterase family protein n=1 Tax=Vibrio sp. YMD68 TaxID=3042300 RepID=UPI00249C8C63|nr:glycerophosphodiester phosphodiesterase family protein [Vibrio sp. YMD68]WGV98413.1 glycerophosphodiester phosphodiesterase family protein [Vibrio sp. YMD68]
MIVGHRGAAALAPENTLSGINVAADVGIQWVELDTQLTADGVPVIFHDEGLDRCTNGVGNVEEHTLEQLKKLDAGSWFSSSFVNERIPTLEEALKTCIERNVSMNLEIKIHHERQVEPLVKRVVDVIHSVNFPFHNLLISSFSKSALKECQRRIPDVRRGYITEETSTDYLQEIQALDLYSVHVDQNVLTQAMAQSILTLNYELNIWTLNDPTKAQTFTNMGVTNIITDHPDAL